MSASASVRCRGERGTALVELAVLLPLLAILAFGITEFGLALQDRMVVEGAGRAGTRVGSAAGATAAADQTLLLALGSAVNDVGLDNVSWVVVYKSVTADGVVPATCTGPTPHSVSTSCNAYSGAQLKQIVAGTAPGTWFGCGVGSLDVSWCPTSRQTTQALGNDYLGVWLQTVHHLNTGMFGTQLTLSAQSVMRLEPK